MEQRRQPLVLREARHLAVHGQASANASTSAAAMPAVERGRSGVFSP